jgi:hypothetical protein
MVSVALHANVARHMRSEWINRPQNRLKITYYRIDYGNPHQVCIIKISKLLHCPGHLRCQTTRFPHFYLQ